MRSLLVIVSLFVLSSGASAQIRQAEKQQPHDGESSWVQITSPIAGVSLLTAKPSGDVWMGSAEGMFTSANLGDSWSKVGSAPIAAPLFYDDSNGIAWWIDGSIYTTSDGGASWLPNSSALKPSISTVALATNARAFAVGRYAINRSTDRGKTWQMSELDATSLVAIDFSDALHGFVTGPADVNFTGTCFKTDDGGQSWTRVQCPTHNYWSVACMSEHTILLFSSSGEVARTTNQGQSWTDTLLTEPGEGFGGSFALNEREVFAVAARGQIRYSSDAGASWSSQATSTVATLLSIYFLNDSVGFASGEQGVILRTSNKGKSWVAEKPTNSQFDVHYLTDGNKTIAFEYNLQQNDRMTLSIMSMDGRILSEPLNPTTQEPGLQHVQLDCNALASGAYIYRLNGEHHEASGVFSITK